jgi:dTDP-4-amino-4,6-dideoxygalactose transaminase
LEKESKKENWQNLALFGGVPSFADPRHVGRPNIGNKQDLFEKIGDMLTRRWLTNDGPFVQELENRIEHLLGVNHCIAMCNGTVALQVATHVLGLTGEVIVPSFTFIATAHALAWLGITPVFCDIDPQTHTIDPGKIQELISPRTSGILGVHLWGRPCDVEALEQISHHNNISLMFDAAHAFCCSHNGRMIGNFGRLEVFSFHATKFFNTLEGGAIATNDPVVAEKARLMRDFGFLSTDKVISIGINGKMNEAEAAMGLTGLDSLNHYIEINHRNYKEYRSILSDVPGISVIHYDEAEHNNFQYVILEIDEEGFGMHRDLLLEILNAEKVMARRYFYPGCHSSEPYKSNSPYKKLKLPFTKVLSDRVLALPTGTAMDQRDIKKVCQIIMRAAKYNKEIKRALSSKEA